MCAPNVLSERLQKRARMDDDPNIAKDRYKGHVGATVPAIDHLKEIGTHVVEVSSEEEGEEGWQIFQDALLVSPSKSSPCGCYSSCDRHF